MPATVRARVTLLAVVASAVVLAGTSVALVVLQRRVITENIDESLSHQADLLQAQASFLAVGTALPQDGDDEAAAQVVDLDGRVLAASENLYGAPPVADPPDGRNRYRNIDQLGREDERQRLLSRRFTTSGGEELVLHVARPLDDLDESVRALVASLAGIVPLAVALLGLVVWQLVGRTLHPVEQIRAQVAAIGGSEVDRRVPQPRGHDEIARLAATMNEMLARIEAATRRQQQFVADASHELRTPLTRMRAELEVDIAHPDGVDPALALTSLLEEVDVLQRLVDQLLVLARADAGAPAPTTVVDLDDIAIEESRSVRSPRRTVETSGIAPARVRGDAEQLRRVVRNLLDNATRHARAEVVVTLAGVNGSVELAVADDGPGIEPAEHERIFERFTRLDEARSVAAGGAGLGLAIARELVHRHGGTIAVDPDYRAGARFVVTLPRA